MHNRQTSHGAVPEFEILVVDDTVANLQVVDEILSVAGYCVSAVTSGKRALQQLQQQLPDLILLDVQMPEMDGFETCQQIKANPDTANIPIIFLTALSDGENVVKGLSLGAADYITKPFREAELLARVKTQLNLYCLTERLEEQVASRTEELQSALEQLQGSQLQMIQNEKMAALGNLVAGVAHEINNPVGFLLGSVRTSQDYFRDLSEHLALYQQCYPEPTVAIQEHAESIDLDFLAADMPKLLNSMQGATYRIKDISVSLRTFSRTDQMRQTDVDLHEGLDSTLLILKYRLKDNEHRPAIQIEKSYGELPKIDCFPSQLNQVFLNIVANAIDMFDEAAQQPNFNPSAQPPQTITVQTSTVPGEEQVEIRIGDNGIGMSEAVKAKVFEHLFTTKGVEQGTGLGLAIAHQIVVERHDGELSVESTPGQGSTFVIRLPLAAE